jgi:Fe-S-cluster containining protein
MARRTRHTAAQAQPAAQAGADRRTAGVTLSVAGRPLHVRLEVPVGPTRRRELLPLFQRLADAVIDVGVQQAEAAGERVSCAKGCGACCRQLVPVTEPEAFALRALVDGLPEERRRVVEGRFAAARRRLEEAKLYAGLAASRETTREERHELGMRYFALGIPCPFLEDESCSIHADRPIACREYLVTSPAAHCSAPSAAAIRMLPIPGSVSTALARTGSASTHQPWIALALAPEWATDREEEPPRPGTAIVEEFFGRLGR